MSQRGPGGEEPLGRTARVALGRGLALLAVAVVVGIVLLHTLGPPRAAQAGQPPVSPSPTTSASPSTSTGSGSPTTTVPPTTTTTLAPAKVTVLVANGTGKGLGATHMSAALKSVGYHTLAPVNTTSPQSSPAVYFASGYDQAAAAIANLIKLGPSTVAPIPSSPPVASATGADVIVIEGTALAQTYSSSTTLPAGSTSTGATTATTAAPTGSTPASSSTTAGG